MNQQFIPRQIEMCTHMGQKTCIKVSRCLHIIEKIIQLYIHAIEYCPAKIRGEKITRKHSSMNESHEIMLSERSQSPNSIHYVISFIESSKIGKTN